MEISTEHYSICYDPATATLTFAGSLRLGGPAEYGPIAKLLSDVGDLKPPKITLNLQKLEFLNSSGISMLSKFVIEVRKKAGVQITVLGSHSIPWQGKSLKNLQKLMPALVLDFI
jgi:hypothetical protein